MPARRIDDDFATAARDMHASGKSKEAVARALGCCQRTVRRALAASGVAHTVDGYMLPATRYAPRPVAPVDPNAPAVPGQACPRFGEALAREASSGFLPAYA